MATITHRAGEPGTLGFAVDQFDGSPMPTEGLDVRLVVYLAGADLILPGRWETGEVVLTGRPVTHPSIAAFSVTPESLPIPARVYRCALQIDDGTGWRTLDEHVLEVRKL